MPIKEIITFGFGVLAVLVAMNPLHFKEAVRHTQIQILKEVGRTDTWGSPSIFRYGNMKTRNGPYHSH